MTNLVSKDILARLLATENITVQHANVSTASFHVRDRILTLPTWEEMEGYTYDHLVGHEVGHALYTPEKGWHDAVVDGGPVMRSFLNVVEDARIEKLIQRRYPGLRRSFVKSYRKLLADGFFGVNEDHFDSMNLIDRINVHFKCGASIGVRFSAEEKPWLEEIASAETWEEVEDISTRLFAYCKEKYKEQKLQEQEEEDLSAEEEDESDDSGSDVISQPDDSGDSGDSGEESDDSDESEDEGDDGTEVQKDVSGGDSFEDDLKSLTEEELHINIEKEFSQSHYDKVHHFKVPNIDGNKFVLGYKDTIQMIDQGLVEYDKYRPKSLKGDAKIKADILFQEFYKENKRVVDHMANEFEMKKKAEEYARASTSKTGVIDTVKMNNYLFEDDIFRKVTVVPEGKNHGILIYLDWSGSMSGKVYAAVQQMSIIAMFCRKVNIPFRVFIFTNQSLPEHSAPKIDYANTAVCLREIFNERMRNSEFRKICSFLLLYGSTYDGKIEYFFRRAIDESMTLCGTPLNQALICASSVHDSFKEQHRLQNVATFFITDGQSDNAFEYSREIAPFGTNTLVKMVDEKTKKQYRLDSLSCIEETNKLIRLYKDRTGSNVIGYFIAPKTQYGYNSGRRNIGMSYNDSEVGYREYRKKGYIICPHVSYDKYFIISEKQLLVKQQKIKVEEGSSNAKIRNAFKKSQNSKKFARMMVGEVAEELS